MVKYNRKHFGCKIKGCKEKHEGLGYCQKHYNSFHRHGNPLATPHKGKVKIGKYLECQTCEKIIYVIFSHFHKKHFCSRKCYAKSRIGKHPSIETLQKMSGRTPWNKDKHTGIKPWFGKKRPDISKKLKGIKHSIFRIENIIKGIREKSPNYNGGKTFTIQGYIGILIGRNANGHSKYYPEHRLIMEKHLGRRLTNEEVVHHINKKRNDNRIENLMLFTNDNEHFKYHRLLRSGS